MVQPTNKRLVTEASVGGHVLTHVTTGQGKTAIDAAIGSQITTPGTPAALALSGAIGDATAPLAPSAAVGYKATKVGAFTVSGGAGGSAEVTTIKELLSRIPFRLPVKPSRARIHIENRNIRDEGSITPGAFAFTGFWVGEPVLNAAGGLTADFKTAPTQLVGAFSTPADGTPHITPWFNVTTILPKRDYLLSYGYTVPLGTITHRGTGQQFWTSNTGDAAKAGNITMAAPSSNQQPHFDMWLEYEFTGANPVNLFIGDSQTDGMKCATGQRDNYPQMHSRRTGGVSAINAYAGISMPGFDVGKAKWSKYAALTFDAAYVHIGTNDIAGGATLADCQTRLGVIINNIRAIHGADIPIYMGLCTPRGFAAGPEAVRVAYNTWLRTQPFGISAIMDFDRAIRSASNLAIMDPDFDSTDGTHPSAAGYDKMASVVPYRVSVTV